MSRQTQAKSLKRAAERKDNQASQNIIAFNNAVHGFETTSPEHSSSCTKFGTVLLAALNADLVSKHELRKDFGITADMVDKAKAGRSTGISADARTTFIDAMKDKALVALEP